jgi:hypothetical protein
MTRATIQRYLPASKLDVIGEAEPGRGDACPEKALRSQCALWMPIGDTSRRKVLRYQQTARNVLNRGGTLVTRPPRNDSTRGRWKPPVLQDVSPLNVRFGSKADITPS